ncbi:hypothetical protein [Hymenobacter nivis]|uniref:hypothetical protein n=1 Tax=Hymenobacter nivis TaxID=1850093 RepID=UPI0013A589B1|nr:hypothetical protein [Hymenobacter nivis]
MNPAQSSPQTYTGQNLNGTILINGSPTTNPQITIIRQPFLLEIHKFNILITNNSFFSKLIDPILGATIGLFINLIAKLIGNKIDTTIQFDKWEVYAFVISLIIMLSFMLLNYLVPNDRKKLINEINNHFQKP